MSSSASPPSPLYDFAVIGLGGHGIQIAYQLARQGQRVLGLERFEVAHANGSSHGESRITRLAYWEHPSYVPLLRRAFELYGVLEKESGQRLFLQTGSLDMGPKGDPTFEGSVLSCRTYGLEHEILTSEELSARFPAWNLPKDFRACFQPKGGMLFPEKIISATAALARSLGADLRERIEVVDIIPTGWGVEIRSRDGQVFRAKKVVLSAGAWLPTLLAKSSLGLASPRLRSLAALLRPERQVVSWWAPESPGIADSRFVPSKFPVWIANVDAVNYYGFPLLEGGQAGLKIGRYHHGNNPLNSEAAVSDLQGRQSVRKEDAEETRQFMGTMMRGVRTTSASGANSGGSAALKVQTCMFTNTPDEHFILDPHPDKNFPQVSLVSACSGHGFKFTPVVGEAMALALVRKDGQEKSQLEQDVEWLGAGRLLGDREPLQNVKLPSKL
jgi:sarcosine oxidase